MYYAHISLKSPKKPGQGKRVFWQKAKEPVSGAQNLQKPGMPPCFLRSSIYNKGGFTSA